MGALWPAASWPLSAHLAHERSAALGNPIAARGNPLRGNLTRTGLRHFIIVRKYKLLYCYFPKVGGTSMNMLLFKMSGEAPAAGKDSSESHGHLSPDALGWTREDLQAALEDDSWTKAVLYRDPVERFISAYMSKCKTDLRRLARPCKRHFGSKVTFLEAVRMMGESQPFGTRRDQHFAPQYEKCGDLRRTIGWYQFAHQFKKETIRQIVMDMRARVGAERAATKAFEESYPAAGKHPGSNNAATTSEQEMRDLFANVTDDEFERLVDYYEGDYETFGLPRPSSKRCWPTPADASC